MKKIINLEKLIYIGFAVSLVAFFLYSFTQIDLSLTFSRVEFLRNLVKSFQYIGYFNRPLSAGLYISFIIIFHLFYFFFLHLAGRKKITIKKAWTLIFTAAVVLVFSYNTFSYDLFNYIFDAKIITHYQQNPYIHKALDFPGDPMLSFMRWTHRVYPYGPVWLALTVPLSFIGLNFFLPTFFLFKLLMAGSFLGTVYYIGKILRKISPEREVWGTIFFGLNPLIIIETLVSAHLDIVMLFFAVWSLYQLTNKKYTAALILLGISIGIKFATAALLPVYLIIILLQIKNKKINWDIIFFTSLVLMIGTVIYASGLSNFQPWYLLEALFIAVFLSDRYFVLYPSVITSFFALLMYVPYLYLGNWDPPVPQILKNLQLISYISSALAVAAYFFTSKFIKRAPAAALATLKRK